MLGNENATIHIDAVIDPLSPTGQKLASLLQVLKKHVQTSMRIVLNPMVSKTYTAHLIYRNHADVKLNVLSHLDVQMAYSSIFNEVTVSHVEINIYMMLQQPYGCG